MNKLALCSAILVSTALAYEPKPHEQWWQANSIQKIPLFRQWYGDADTKERMLLCSYLKEKQYQSILDVGCSLCSLFFAIKKEKVEIQYTGLEVTKAFIDRAQKFGIAVLHASAEEIPCEDNAYDIVYARHVLEHLPHYEKALTEMIRVAKHEVRIAFFKHPNNWTPDMISKEIVDSLPVYHNFYNKQMIDAMLKANPKVASISWQYVGQDYVVSIRLT